MSESGEKTIRVEIERLNGRIIQLTGDDAERWSDALDRMCLGKTPAWWPPVEWKTIKRARGRTKKGGE